MSVGVWLIVLFVGLPLLVAFLWALFRGSIVQVPVGTLGLLVVKGKPTDKSLVPGLHWVPTLRKRQSVSYPAVELSYRAGAEPAAASSVEASGPALKVILGDRVEAVVGYTVRFRLMPEELRIVHERFGTSGYWSAVRDDSGAAVMTALADPEVTMDSLYPGERAALEVRLKEAVTAALSGDGMVVTGFSLGTIDLGRAGETVQATLRARLELAREEAEAGLRELRVRHDAELSQYLTEVGDTALRYRQTEVWRDLANRPDNLRLSYPGPSVGTASEAAYSMAGESGSATAAEEAP
ncbi:MAG: SPFH domain-containing protein [Propionicimonas sp.]